MNRLRFLFPLAGLLLALPAAHADDPVRGRTLYQSDCASCHGGSPLTSNSNRIFMGRNARSAIDSGIANVGDMNGLRSRYPAGGSALADLAAYLGNTPTTLSFPATTVGATSAAQTVTVYASLRSTAAISALAVSTTGDYVRTGGTCATSVAAGGSCTVVVAFRPTTAGTRSGSLKLQHAGTLTPIAIALTGSASSAAAPVAAIAPASIGFGSVTVGLTSSTHTATLSNTGNAALHLGTLSATPADFRIAGGTCAAGGTVAAGASCTVGLRFAPSAAGSRSGSLAVTHDAAGGRSAVALAGTGVAASPAIAVSPGALSFSQTVGTSSAAQTVTVSNTGTAPLNLGTLALGGTRPADYSIAAGTTCAAGGSVAAGSQCVVKITFAPAAAGTRNASLAVTHDAPGSPSTVALQGTAAAAPQPVLALNASALAFGSHVVGVTSTARSVTVTNSGGAALVLGSIAASGSAAGDFTRSGTCADGASLAAGGSCTLRYAFTPAATGSRTASVAVPSNGGNATLALSGTGTAVPVPAVQLLPSAVAFGNVTAGSNSAVRNVVLTNTGSGPLAIGAITATAGFAVTHDCPASLAAAAQCTLALRFAPPAAGAATGSVTVASDADGSPHAVALSGTGVAPVPTLAWTPTTASLDFGEATIGDTAATRTLTLANQGPGAATLQGFTIGGAQAGDYALAGGSCAIDTVLADGASCTLVVGFQPAATGPRNAALQVASTGSDPADVALSGSGAGPAQPAVEAAPASLQFQAAGGAAAAPQTLTLSNPGGAALQVSAVRLAGDGFALDAGTCPAAPFELAPSASCSLVVGWSGSAAGNGTLQIDSNAAPATLAVALEATASTAPAALPNEGGGGCSIARGAEARTDPTLWALAALAALLLWRRRARPARNRHPDEETPR